MWNDFCSLNNFANDSNVSNRDAWDMDCYSVGSNRICKLLNITTKEIAHGKYIFSGFVLFGYKDTNFIVRNH